MYDSGHDDFLQKLSTAFEETDGLVGFWEGVVRLMGFQDRDYFGLYPRMSTTRQAFVIKVDEAGGVGFKSPFEKLVPDSAGAWC